MRQAEVLARSARRDYSPGMRSARHFSRNPRIILWAIIFVGAVFFGAPLYFPLFHVVVRSS